MDEHSNPSIIEGIKSLEKQWGQFQLSKDEQHTIIIYGEVTEEDCSNEQRSVLGRLCMEQSVGKEAIRTTMGKIWKLSQATEFKEVGKNTFIITFSTKADKS